MYTAGFGFGVLFFGIDITRECNHFYSGIHQFCRDIRSLLEITLLSPSLDRCRNQMGGGDSRSKMMKEAGNGKHPSWSEGGDGDSRSTDGDTHRGVVGQVLHQQLQIDLCPQP